MHRILYKKKRRVKYLHTMAPSSNYYVRKVINYVIDLVNTIKRRTLSQIDWTELKNIKHVLTELHKVLWKLECLVISKIISSVSICYDCGRVEISAFSKQSSEKPVVDEI